MVSASYWMGVARLVQMLKKGETGGRHAMHLAGHAGM
jgi:hypothetical protein